MATKRSPLARPHIVGLRCVPSRKAVGQPGGPNSRSCAAAARPVHHGPLLLIQTAPQGAEGAVMMRLQLLGGRIGGGGTPTAAACAASPLLPASVAAPSRCGGASLWHENQRASGPQRSGRALALVTHARDGKQRRPKRSAGDGGSSSDEVGGGAWAAHCEVPPLSAPACMAGTLRCTRYRLLPPAGCRAARTASPPRRPQQQHVGAASDHVSPARTHARSPGHGLPACLASLPASATSACAHPPHHYLTTHYSPHASPPAA